MLASISQMSLHSPRSVALPWLYSTTCLLSVYLLCIVIDAPAGLTHSTASLSPATLRMNWQVYFE